MIELWDADAVDIEVTVQDGASGGARDLTGATVTGRVRRDNGRAQDLSVTVADAPAGVVRMRVQPPLLRPGNYRVQLRVQIGFDAQVVLDEPLCVREAIK